MCVIGLHVRLRPFGTIVTLTMYMHKKQIGRIFFPDPFGGGGAGSYLFLVATMFFLRRYRQGALFTTVCLGVGAAVAPVASR